MMCKNGFLAGLYLFFSLCSRAGDGDYAVSKIPAALLKNAHAVKRMERIVFDVTNTGEAILKRIYAITILDENGDRFGGFGEYYDKLHEIRNIEGTLYNAEGKEIKRLKNKQIIDMTGSDDNNLVDDNRRKYHHFFHKVYPYTVQYEVEIRYNGTLFFPIWLPREGENLSVEQSHFTITAPEGYGVRYKSFNYTGEPVLTPGDKKRGSVSWEVKGLPAVEDEYGSPDWYDINTVVLTGPTEFELERYTGNMSSWEGFGKFVYALKQGRDQLPVAVQKTVHQLTDNITDPIEKISLLYDFLQKNTRYVSIQLGIGGWQPFDASYVASKAYGDCKALTNYMYSLLKEAGIYSCYTLVRAGRGAHQIIADFPSQQFNHVILCVPLQKDTVWLECTNQTIPAGYLGSFTADRYALMITENGGKLVRTPKYGLNENVELRHIKSTLNEEGTLITNAVTDYSGLQQDAYHALINNLSKDKVKEVLHEELDFGTYEVLSFDYQERKGKLPVIREKLDITVSNYATITGKRLFIVPNVMTRTKRKLSAVEERKYDLVLGLEFKDVDTVEISLPSGYAAEYIPQDVSLVSKFGKYVCSVRLNGEKIIYYRSFEHYSGRFPAADYTDLLNFYNTIYKADRNRVVLVKNQ